MIAKIDGSRSHVYAVGAAFGFDGDATQVHLEAPTHVVSADSVRGALVKARTVLAAEMMQWTESRVLYAIPVDRLAHGVRSPNHVLEFETAGVGWVAIVLSQWPRS